MNKDIYIIKNKINNKVYIGQAKNTEDRFRRHCNKKEALKSNSIIDKAIQKHGQENFFYEILESQIEDYNEKEKFWIAYYNSLTPNGYNILPGGDAPPVVKGSDHPESLLSEKLISKLTDDLKNSSLSMASLAEKYGFSSRASIADFNKGKTYYREDIDYPIRKDIHNGKLSEKDIDIIYDKLLNTKLTFTKIAEDFGVEARAISRINQGSTHKKEGYKYPIRRTNK